MDRRGGARPGAGRPKGSINKVKKSLAEEARKYGPEALQALVNVMRTDPSNAVRKDAANSILDRGYGKPSQYMDIDADIKSDVLVTAISLVGKDE